MARHEWIFDLSMNAVREEAMRRHRRLLQLGGRRSSVGPGHQGILYNDGVYHRDDSANTTVTSQEPIQERPAINSGEQSQDHNISGDPWLTRDLLHEVNRYLGGEDENNHPGEITERLIRQLDSLFDKTLTQSPSGLGAEAVATSTPETRKSAASNTNLGEPELSSSKGADHDEGDGGGSKSCKSSNEKVQVDSQYRPGQNRDTYRDKNGPSSSTKNRRSRALPENRRKVLRILLQNKSQLACPDSGSEKNIMSEAFAKSNHLRITRKSRDIKPFELGSGKTVWSIGRVRATVELLGSTIRQKLKWFYVFPNCPVPLILGMAFLTEAEILTKNRHMLENCPAEFSNVSSLLWIGTPRKRHLPPNRMKCCLDGRNLVGVADTGSDLNFMSPECAKREGFHIDDREEMKIRVQLGDGTETETIGRVYIHNLTLDWREPVTETVPNPTTSAPNNSANTEPSSQTDESFGAIFHVLPGLRHDVILGRDFLYEMDAFNRCPELLYTRSTNECDPFELNILVSIQKGNFAKTAGGLFKFNIFGSRRKRKLAERALPNSKEIHDNERHMEMLRRANREDEISRMPSDQQRLANARERQKGSEWDAKHTTCIYCNAT
ncbi:hypothetical protein F5884DRAFT_507900 [Xylogone sp. PMI_703]|nr:hypothetical protein F5884DRAFT_507900 [Xylogone sp. PMI_703]